MKPQTDPHHDWTRQELDIIVADYFTMLRAELRNEPYVKADHRRAVMDKTGRSKGSVEFKHQNISAVLQQQGQPWIQGYKPRRNIQAALVDAIDRHLAHTATAQAAAN